MTVKIGSFVIGDWVKTQDGRWIRDILEDDYGTLIYVCKTLLDDKKVYKVVFSGKLDFLIPHYESMYSSLSRKTLSEAKNTIDSFLIRFEKLVLFI